MLTTHYLDEAEHLADRVAVLAAGRIVAEGSPAELRDGMGVGTRITFELPAVDEPLSSLLDPLEGRSRGRDRRIEITTSAPTADLAHITTWARDRGIELGGLSVTSTELEDVYLELVGEDA